MHNLKGGQALSPWSAIVLHPLPHSLALPLALPCRPLPSPLSATLTTTLGWLGSMMWTSTTSKASTSLYLWWVWPHTCSAFPTQCCFSLPSGYVPGLTSASFARNIVYLCVSTLYLGAAEGNQGAFAYTSTALSLAVFVAVVAFHYFQQIRNTRLWKILTTRSASHLVEGEPDNDEDFQRERASSRLVTHSEVVLPQHNQRQLQCLPHSEIVALLTMSYTT